MDPRSSSPLKKSYHPLSVCAPEPQGITDLRLYNYRNYGSLSLSCDPLPVVLTGPNGAGKTNILEALSFLSPGKGMRSCKLGEVQRHGSCATAQPWTLFVQGNGPQDAFKIGTSLAQNPQGRETRRVAINDETALPQSHLSSVISVLWLTPSMDRLFMDGATTRRRFLDRLVYAFDSTHASRVHRYEKHMRERHRLLADGYRDLDWMVALEKQMAEEAHAITLARHHTLIRIQAQCDLDTTPFPRPFLSMTSPFVSKKAPAPHTPDALDLSPEAFQSTLRDLLRDHRSMDGASGRTFVGPHTIDFLVHYGTPEGMPAHVCSTGEQKALLLGILLAAACLKAQNTETTTLILLDEVVAHLDPERRARLFDVLLPLPLHLWMTGTEFEPFSPIASKVQHFEVHGGKVTGPNTNQER